MASEIRPKSCTYGCGVEIYWNTEENTYWELYSGKKHICPNRTTTKKLSLITPPSNAAKPIYYNKKDLQSKQQQQNQRWITLLNCLLEHQNP